MISQDNPDAPLTFQESKLLVHENNDLRFEIAQIKKTIETQVKIIADQRDRIGELEKKSPLKAQDYKALTDQYHKLQQVHNTTIDKMVEMQKTIDTQDTHIKELEEALKKTTFITASNVQNESQISMENAKYRTLLQVVSTPVTITQTGDYILYSDPIKRLLEIRKQSPRP